MYTMYPAKRTLHTVYYTLYVVQCTLISMVLVYIMQRTHYNIYSTGIYNGDDPLQYLWYWYTSSHKSLCNFPFIGKINNTKYKHIVGCTIWTIVREVNRTT